MKCYFVPPDDHELSDLSDPDEDDDAGSGITPLSPALLARHGARVLDPSTAPSAEGWPRPRPAVYRTRKLLVPPRFQRAPYLGAINAALARAGMRLVPVARRARSSPG